jgi:hypothetical protein
MIKRLTLASVVGGILLLGSAQATQIASFGEANGTQDFSLSLSGGANALTASSAIFIVLANTVNPALSSVPITATLTITGDSSTTSGSVNTGSFLTQSGYQAGTFSIVGTGTYAGLGTILSGTFGGNGANNSGISGSAAGYSATFSSSDGVSNYSEVIFNSALWNFATSNGIESLSFSLSNLSAALSLTGGYIPGSTGLTNSFTAAGSGTFSATLQSSPVPEPGTMGLLGAALVGLGLLGRKRVRR